MVEEEEKCDCEGACQGLQILTTQSVVHGPALPTTPTSLLEMQNHTLRLSFSVSESAFRKISSCFIYTLNLESHCSKYL